MRRCLYKILICIAVAAAAVTIGHLLFSRTVDITVIYPETFEDTPEDSVTENKPVAPAIVISETVSEGETSPNDIPAESPIEDKTQIVPPKNKEESGTSTVAAPPVEKDKKIEISAAEPPQVVEKKDVPEKTPDTTEKKVEIPVIVSENPEKTQKIYVPGWTEDFSPDYIINGVKSVDGWSHEGGVIFTPKTRFYLHTYHTDVANTVLVIEAKKSSAVFVYDLSNKVDLNKTPILRWRWRVKKLPPFADGRHRKKDDQAVGIYIGTGTAFDQKSIAYRWETETPVMHWGRTTYSNVMKVHFLCMRNKNDGLDVWYEESRNVRMDFIDKFGFVPKKIALVICGNSQNSKSEALAEIDHIGFYKEEFVLPTKK